eukprot:GHVS01061234.1.p2 GENE.GHVS01061234.1~~GHVS01061234.1.p2  ORF type:complete len:127 (+),score=10.15 GHVS01061234.1:494-874(+)
MWSLSEDTLTTAYAGTVPCPMAALTTPRSSISLMPVFHGKHPAPEPGSLQIGTQLPHGAGKTTSQYHRGTSQWLFCSHEVETVCKPTRSSTDRAASTLLILVKDLLLRHLSMRRSVADFNPAKQPV